MDITVKGRIEPKPYSWLERELKCIDPDLRFFWHNKWQRWAVIRRVPANVFRRGYIIEALVHDGRNGYAPLDRRVIGRLKQAIWEREHLFDTPDKFFRAEKQEEQKKAEDGAKQRRDAMREFQRQVYRHRKTMTFV